MTDEEIRIILENHPELWEPVLQILIEALLRSEHQDQHGEEDS